MEKQYKVIINATIARQLLKLGHVVVDIKPKKNEKGASVFVFEDTDKFRADLGEISNSRKGE